MSFRIDPLAQSFVYDKNVDKKPDDEVHAALTAQVQAIDAEFSDTIQTMLQNLYQRQSERNKIAIKHPKWHRQLTLQYQAIIDEENALQKLVTQIPLLDKGQENALGLILQIVVMHYSVKRSTKELEVVLGAVEHQESLKLYKDTLKAYEALVVKPIHESTVDELVTLFTVSQQHFLEIDRETKLPFLIQEIDQLNREICESTLSTIIQLQNGVKDKFSPVYKRLENLKSKVTDALLKLPPQIRSKDPRPEVQRAILETYLQKTSSHPLPQEESFKNGLWFRTIRYAQIIPQIDTLDSIARAVNALGLNVQTRLVSHLTGQSKSNEPVYISKDDIRYFTSLISGLEAALHAERLTLSNMEVTEKVRAGLYYVSRLRASLHNVQRYIDIAKRVVKGNASYHVKAIHSIRQLVMINTVSNLYKAVKAALLCPKDVSHSSSFTKAMCPITSTLINDTIAIVSKKTLSLSNADKEVPNKLFAKLPLTLFYGENESMYTFPRCLRNYFMKGFLSKVYFTKDREASDPEFEATLHLFSHAQEYKSSFTQCLRDDIEFKELYMAHQEVSRIPQHTKSLTLTVEIRTLLEEISTESPTVIPLIKYKIWQLIYELEQIEPTSNRLSWIKELAGLPSDFLTEPASQELVSAVFATDEEKRQASLEIASKLLESADPKHSLSPHVAFRLFIDKRIVPSSEHKSLLLTFFNDYLSNVEFYRSLYDTITLETALAQFIQIEPKVLSTIATKRTMKHFTLWQNMATLTKEHALECAQSHFKKAGLDPQSSTYSPLTHQDIASFLYYQLL